MWYVCDEEFGFLFSDGCATVEEAEVEMVKIQSLLYEQFHEKQNFVILFIEG